MAEMAYNINEKHVRLFDIPSYDVDRALLDTPLRKIFKDKNIFADIEVTQGRDEEHTDVFVRLVPNLRNNTVQNALAQAGKQLSALLPKDEPPIFRTMYIDPWNQEIKETEGLHAVLNY